MIMSGTNDGGTKDSSPSLSDQQINLSFFPTLSILFSLFSILMNAGRENIANIEYCAKP